MKRNPMLALLLVFSLCSSACGEDVGLGTRSSSPSTADGDATDDQQPSTSSPSSDRQMEHTGQGGEHGEGDGDSGNGGASPSGEGSGGSSSDGGDKTSSEDGQMRDDATGQPDCSGCAETSNFAARQIAMQRVKVPGEELITRYQFMLTDTPGRLACMAIDDTRTRPAGAGWQIFATFYLQEERDAPASCPVGEYLMTPGYSCSELFDDLTPARDWNNMWCMVRRTWNEDGTVLSTEVAQAGLVTVREVEDGCRFDTEIVFNGDEHLFGVHVLPEVDPFEPTCGYSL